ncbi:RICIN domain-containing protein [Verrucomicrobiales bacterium BCK34]|nr:RICIN domain-containing protein [Verrucomicrobiales bacterium BCK34]
MKALIPLVIVISCALIPAETPAGTVEITASQDGYEIVHLPSKRPPAEPEAKDEPAAPLEPPYCDPAEPEPTVWHSIICKSSQNAISVSTAYRQNGIGIIEWEPHRTDDQQWRIARHKDGWFHLIARHSGKALAIRDGKTTENADAIQWEILDEDSQLWKFEFDEDGFARLKNKSSGLYLATYSKGGNHGRNLLQKTKADTDDQKWLIQIVDLVE